MKNEPRPSLLLAIAFTGIALMLIATKGYLPEWIGIAGQWLMIGGCTWLRYELPTGHLMLVS